MSSTIDLPGGNTVVTTAISGGFATQMIDASGQPVGAAFAMAINGMGYYSLESVTAQSGGGFVVDYSYDGPLLPGTEHFAASFTSAGVAAAPPILLDQSAPLHASAQAQAVTPPSVTAAEVARLYDTTLGRMPDQAGEAFWTKALDPGSVTLLQATQAFIGSAEFQATYGAVNDGRFVQLLFENTLHREPDGMGLAYWTSALAVGHTRAEIVLNFSESAEHVALLAPHIDQGIWFT